MALSQRIQPWSGVAYRHLPAVVRKAGVLDFRYAGRAADNRWNHPGEPTLYLASDVGVALAEWARHFEENRTQALARQTQKRTVWALTLTLQRVLDLRDQAVWAELQLAAAPHCFLDKAAARASAQFVRRTTESEALLVPTMGFLDDLARWALVLFLEKLPPDPTHFITAVVREGPFRWR